MAKSFNQILEYSGLNAIDFSNAGNMQIPQLTQQNNQPMGQGQPQSPQPVLATNQ